ncbi:MAG: DUF4003 family protein [Lachnospiraceae bacterium]|nr:DUF4003 family protein [Lachnospiraceae bacterium]
MNTGLEQSINQFIEHKTNIEKNIVWEYDFNLCISTLLCVRYEKTLEPLKIKRYKNMMQKKTKAFSNYRGVIGLPCATLLSFYENPQEVFDETISASKYLRKNNFKNSNYFSFALLQMGEKLIDLDAKTIEVRVTNLYQQMKKKYKVPTDALDYGYLSILAQEETDSEQLAHKADQLYRLAKKEGTDSGNSAMLAKILCLSDSENEALIKDAYTLYGKLKEQKIKFSDYFTGTFLGILTLLSENFDETVKDILEVNQTLRQKKGISTMLSDKGQRMLYSVLLVILNLSNEKKDLDTLKKNQLLDIAFATAVSTGAGILSNFQ